MEDVNMVVPAIWIQPWVVVTISLIALFVIFTFILYCICWEQKKSSPRFYILDESGLNTSSMSEFAQSSRSSLRLFRRLSTTQETRNEGIFTSKNLPFFKMAKDLVSDIDPLDSFDTSQSFENSTLQMENDSSKEELRSCISSDSQHTFYSTLPAALARSNSRVTFHSVEYNTDSETLLD